MLHSRLCPLAWPWPVHTAHRARQEEWVEGSCELEVELPMLGQEPLSLSFLPAQSGTAMAGAGGGVTTEGEGS